jgi:hypothetical protein
MLQTDNNSEKKRLIYKKKIAFFLLPRDISFATLLESASSIPADVIEKQRAYIGKIS